MLKCERALGSWKDEYKLKILCIVGQDDQRCVIVVDHSCKFEGIYLMVNPRGMGYGNENGTRYCQFQEKS